ncbi:ATP-dependent helicase [Plebeiibacterium sediminum]|uniref:DNA 3'-5' helicase n=1 Tax=Plebeiibacterium sediminum TaxID=2992112 RepID=A0AAE3SGU8_9BACT|nr:ATP-dependent helicase [Plebeiobacterium sediminum]MCW3788863.1 ATP-dependent helicase [Plebeiobacterium sediminum]
MSYKRLHSRLKSSNENKLDQIVNAFEAEGRALQHHFTPEIDYPKSDYNNEIQYISSLDEKLGRTFQRLNQHQRHAVFHPSCNTILSAMVGSGKTTVLIAKIFYLHFIKHIPFDKMIVLTFTNKAAREIKERIATFLGDAHVELKEQLRYFGTFHAVARQLLNEHPDLNKIGFKADFMIMDEQEKQDFLERLIAQENLSIKYHNQLTKRWRKYIETGDALMGNMKNEDDFIQLVQLAQTEKRKINAMDFDDLISLCNEALNHQVAISPEWIIVDEFQDCNEDQLQLIEKLRNHQSNIFVVGDQNQSIYGWRGSKDHLFEEVHSRWNTTWMELPQNYRSTANILSAAESLLQQNENVLIATRKSGTPIDLIRHYDDQQEAFYLKEQLTTIQKENLPLDNIAILFRTHQQIKIVETVLAQANIPHQLVKKAELHDNPAQNFLLRVLKVCMNHNDSDACLALIFDTNFGVLKRSKRVIQSLNTREGNTTALSALCEYLEKHKSKPLLHIKLLRQIEKFTNEFLHNETLETIAFIDFLALRDILKPTSIHHKEYIDAVTEAWEQIVFFIKAQGWGEKSTMFQLAIGQVVLEGTFHINGRIKQKGQGVHLLTIHASKGLEFDKVYIAGANTGIIPLSQHQKGSQNLKEEKRLLFVAITRGKNNVEIGWHSQPSTRNTEAEPSYFLNAIPAHLLNRKTSAAQNKTEEQTEESAEWQIDMLVKHKKYGSGVIISMSETELICNFDSVGEKPFSIAFAKALLVKIES